MVSYGNDLMGYPGLGGAAPGGRTPGCGPVGAGGGGPGAAGTAAFNWPVRRVCSFQGVRVQVTYEG